MTNDQIQTLDKFMSDGVSGKVFPGAVLLVSKGGRNVFFKAYGYADLFSCRLMKKDTVFDLASLTKPLATTLGIMKLVQMSKTGLDQNLGSILPKFANTDKNNIKIENLLYHNSGLSAYRPYFQKIAKHSPEVGKSVLRKLLVKEPILYPAGEKMVYSDIGFMILEWVIDFVTGEAIDVFLKKQVYEPLGLENLFFAGMNSGSMQVEFAATEFCPWRKILLNGKVHDENAYAVGGVSGHAGLFGTTKDVGELLSVLMSSYSGYSDNKNFDKYLVHTFFERNKNTGRALGFDTPAATGSSCGQYFSNNTVGHLGFTGTSFWMDLERAIIIVLLTNRVHPSRSNEKIKAFRPKLHDLIMKSILNP